MSNPEQFRSFSKVKEAIKDAQERVDLSMFEKPIGTGLDVEKQLSCSVVREGRLDDLIAFETRMNAKEESETLHSFYNGSKSFEARVKEMEGLYKGCIDPEHPAFALIVKDREGDPVALGQLVRSDKASDTWDIALLVSHIFRHSAADAQDARPHVGTELLDRLLEYARRRHIRRIETISHNMNAIKLMVNHAHFKITDVSGSERTIELVLSEAA